MKRCYLFLLIIFATFSATACSSVDDTTETRTSLLKTANPNPVVVKETTSEERLVDDIKKTALSVNGIYDVAVVKGKEKDCLVGFKVRHLERFRMKKIEKQLTEKLEKKFSELNFTVSSDYKIFLESVRLNEKIKKDHLSEEKREKRLQEIIKLSTEKT